MKCLKLLGVRHVSAVSVDGAVVRMVSANWEMVPLFRFMCTYTFSLACFVLSHNALA